MCRGRRSHQQSRTTVAGANVMLTLTTPFDCCEGAHTVVAFEIDSFVHSPDVDMGILSATVSLTVKAIAVTQCGDGRIRKSFRVYDAGLIAEGETASFSDQWLLENVVHPKFEGVYSA